MLGSPRSCSTTDHHSSHCTVSRSVDSRSIGVVTYGPLGAGCDDSPTSPLRGTFIVTSQMSPDEAVHRLTPMAPRTKWSVGPQAAEVDTRGTSLGSILAGQLPGPHRGRRGELNRRRRLSEIADSTPGLGYGRTGPPCTSLVQVRNDTSADGAVRYGAETRWYTPSTGPGPARPAQYPVRTESDGTFLKSMAALIAWRHSRQIRRTNRG
jgi:hypothetical protein